MDSLYGWVVTLEPQNFSEKVRKKKKFFVKISANDRLGKNDDPHRKNTVSESALRDCLREHEGGRLRKKTQTVKNLGQDVKKEGQEGTRKRAEKRNPGLKKWS